MATSKLSRRALLGALLVSAGAAGCSSQVDRYAQPGIPDTITPPGGLTRHPIAHLLNRATYGPRPGEIEAVEKLGRDTWLWADVGYWQAGPSLILFPNF